MHARVPFMALLLVVAECCGDSFPSGDQTPPQSFDVEVKLNYPKAWQGGDFPDTVFPTSYRLTVRVQGSGDGKGRLVIGGGGVTAVVPLTVAADGQFVFDENNPALLDERRTSAEMAIIPSRSVGCTSIARASFQSLRLRAQGARLSGSATGFVNYSHTDYVGTRAFTALIVGVPDKQAPVPRVDPVADRDPFAGLVVMFAEPLPTGTTATFEGNGVEVALKAWPDEFPSHFVPAEDRLVPFGDRLRLKMSPALMDLQGNTTTSSLMVTTMKPPAIFDGFAGAPKGLLQGGGQTVEVPAMGSRPAVRGLWLPAGPANAEKTAQTGGRFTARLSAPVGSKDLMIAYRLAGTIGDQSRWHVRAAFVGGVLAERYGDDALLATDATQTSDSRLGNISPVRKMRLPISPGQADEIFVDMDNTFSSCGGPVAPSAGLIIEEIRAE